MKRAVPIATALLCACSQPAPQQQGTENAVAPVATSIPASPSPQPQRPPPLVEPKGPIDPKSVEAAGQVVQSYGALIEQKRWPEANALWGNAKTPTQFQTQLSRLSEVHLEIGNVGDPEGAAGSIYVTMPVIFYGDAADGQPFRRSADVILRRVNDVPGSSEEQRRWHIERIEWKDAP
jgi:hypothetical protein